MQIKFGETQPWAATSGTYDGVLVTVQLNGVVNNVEIVPTDFLPVLVTLQTKITRAGQQTYIHNDNLLNLGTYWTHNNSYERFYNGYDIQQPTSGLPNNKIRTAWIQFGSPITLNPGDRLDSQMSVPTASAVAAHVNTSTSTVDVMYTPSDGYECGIPTTMFEVVTPNETNKAYVNSDLVRKVMFINYDQNDFSTLVVANIGFSSDKIQYNAQWFQLYSDDYRKFPLNKAYRFFSGSTAGTALFMGLDWLPQCLALYKGLGSNRVLNQCSAMLTFNSANVNASQNYVGRTTLYLSPQTAKQTANRMYAHTQQAIARVYTGQGG